jgi:hypothetical protein
VVTGRGPAARGKNEPEIEPRPEYSFHIENGHVRIARRVCGIAVAYEASRLIFGGTRDWHLGEHPAQVAQRAGLDLASMDAAIADHTLSTRCAGGWARIGSSAADGAASATRPWSPRRVDAFWRRSDKSRGKLRQVQLRY